MTVGPLLLRKAGTTGLQGLPAQHCPSSGQWEWGPAQLEADREGRGPRWLQPTPSVLLRASWLLPVPWGTGRGDYINTAAGSLGACCGDSRCHWPRGGRGRQRRQEGLCTCGLATLNALCESWCESSCGQKSKKQTPLGLRRSEEQSHSHQWPSPVAYTLGEHSTSTTSKGTSRKGAPGEEGAECASPARSPHLQAPVPT